MNHFTLNADDYDVIACELNTLYGESNHFKVAAQFYMFFKDVLASNPSFKTTAENIQNKDFSALPSVNMNNLIKYKFWPGDDYSMQVRLFHHFKKKDIDISEDFRAIASQQDESVGSMQGKYALIYSEGLFNGVFSHKKDLFNIYDYLSSRNNNQTFNDRLLFIINEMVDISFEDKHNFKLVSSCLNTLLSKYISTENIYLKRILNKIKDKDFTNYTHIQQAILFKDHYLVEKEGISLALIFDLKKMQEIFKTSESQIIWTFDSFIKYYQNNRQIVEIFSTQINSVVKIVANFETLEKKNLWKDEFDALLEAAKNQDFGNLDVKDLLAKAVFAMKLDKTLPSKNQKQKLKKI